VPDASAFARPEGRFSFPNADVLPKHHMNAGPELYFRNTASPASDRNRPEARHNSRVTIALNSLQTSPISKIPALGLPTLRLRSLFSEYFQGMFHMPGRVGDKRPS
jgi:hypothetical protein